MILDGPAAGVGVYEVFNSDLLQPQKNQTLFLRLSRCRAMRSPDVRASDWKGDQLQDFGRKSKLTVVILG